MAKRGHILTAPHTLGSVKLDESELSDSDTVLVKIALEFLVVPRLRRQIFDVL